MKIMNRITNDNFKENYSNIEKALKNASFIAIDAEFSGMQCTGEVETNLSLFDSPEERYEKLRKNIEPFTVLQFGLTAFIHKNGENKYRSETFVFHLLPRALPMKNRVFLSQGSSIEFLSSYGFNFNQLARDGISFLDEIDEEKLRQSFNNGEPIWLNRDFVSLKGQDEIEEIFQQVQTWLSDTSLQEKFLKIETSSFPVEYLVQKELRHSFKGLWTESSGPRTLSVIKVTEDVRTSLEKENNLAVKLDKELLEYYTGFSRVFKLMTILKKPIVGHNLLLDLMFMHKQFFRPLPKRYENFKQNINRLFPLVYDTKFLSFELKTVLHKATWKSNGLAELYSYFSSSGKCLALNSPHIEISGKNGIFDNEDKVHDAGWDSYCTGYCFIRMAHIYAVHRMNKNADIRVLTNAEIMSGVRDRVNRINLIRADLSHLRLDNPDPPSTRPRWLHVRTTTTRHITARQIAQAFSSFGMVDVKRHSAQCLLVAVPNHAAVRIILERYKKNSDFRVVPYNPLIHSNVGIKILFWAGSLLITGAGVFAWFFNRNGLQTKSLG